MGLGLLVDDYKAELQSNATLSKDYEARPRDLDMEAARSYVMQMQTSDGQTSSNTAPRPAVNK